MGMRWEDILKALVREGKKEQTRIKYIDKTIY